MTNSDAAIRSRRVRVPDSFQAVQDYCWEQGWTDGLPVVPPTEGVGPGDAVSLR